MAILKNTTVNGQLEVNNLQSVTASISSSYIYNLNVDTIESVSDYFFNVDRGSYKIDASAIYNPILFLGKDFSKKEYILSGSFSIDAGDWFARSLAFSLDSETLLIGADNDEASGSPNSSGLAYIFKFVNDSWLESAVLSGSQTDGGEHFGRSVAISGDGKLAIVGAFQDELLGDVNQTGLVYIYEENGGVWQETQILQPSLPNTTSDKGFGRSVSVNKEGDILAVGAFWDEPLGIGGNGEDDQGAVYIFEKISGSWQETKILSGSLTKFGDEFYGRSVCLNYFGDVLAVGAAWDQTSENISDNTGIVYIYKKINNLWQETAILTGSLQEQYFGWEVSLNAAGDTIVVGNPDAFSDSGLVYIFKETNNIWTEEVVLSGSLAVDQSDSFGMSVSIDASGELVAIGAPLDEKNSSITNTGTVYVFEKTNGAWKEKQIITGSYAVDSNDRFGYTVCVDSFGSKIASSAWNDEAPGKPDRSGLVYIYESEEVQIASIQVTNDKTVPVLFSVEKTLSGQDTPFQNPVFSLEGLITEYQSHSSSIYQISYQRGLPITTTIQGGTSPLSYQWFQTDDKYDEAIFVSGATGSSYNYSTYPVTKNFVFIQVSSSAGVENGPLFCWTSNVRIGYLGFAANADASRIVAGVNLLNSYYSIYDKNLNGSWDITRIPTTMLYTGSAGSPSSRLRKPLINDEGNIVVAAYDDWAIFVLRSGSDGWYREAFLDEPPNFTRTTSWAKHYHLNGEGNRIIVKMNYSEKQDVVPPFATSHEHIFIYNSGSSGWQLEPVLTSSYWVEPYYDLFYTVGYSGFAASEEGDMIVVTDGFQDGYDFSIVLGQDPTFAAQQANGAIFIFKSGSTGWYEEQILQGPKKSTNFADTELGFSDGVRISKDKSMIFVGAPAYEHETGKLGAIFVYESSSFDGWQQIYTIKNNTNYESFGQFEVFDNGDIIAKHRYPIYASGGNGGNVEVYYKKYGKEWKVEYVSPGISVIEQRLVGYTMGARIKQQPGSMLVGNFAYAGEGTQKGIIYKLKQKDEVLYKIDKTRFLRLESNETKIVLNSDNKRFFSI